MCQARRMRPAVSAPARRVCACTHGRNRVTRAQTTGSGWGRRERGGGDGSGEGATGAGRGRGGPQR
ncbi:hypothetical protein E3N84_06385 [Terrimesophilobacter mesophilus]|uniref:Uncharacterized protein n=1 Tax=Terrimesophilobacter mesophilus TaxID=433647 RepID=A0A4R8VC62_9MICO|nr:hypothetical protein E3N84_06385 [Terrimesophilobacter mesophilus]